VTLTPDLLRPHQREIMRAALHWSPGTQGDERYLVVAGGRGTMKTSTLVCALAIQLAALTAIYRHYRLLVAAMTYAQLRDVFLVRWQEDVPQSWIPWTYHKQEAEIHLPNGGVIAMRHAGASSSGSISVEKAASLLKGSNYHGFYAPEARAIDGEFYSATQLAVRAEPAEYRPGMPGYLLNWLDCNPGGPDHWIHRKFLDPSTREYKGAHKIRYLAYPTTPETSVYTAERIAEERAGMPEHKAARDLDAQWVGSEGQLFTLYPGDQVTAESLPPGGKWYLSFDFGYEQDPYVALLVYAVGDYAHVVGETQHLRKLREAMLPEVRAMMAKAGCHQIDAVTGDTAGTQGGGFRELLWWRTQLHTQYRPTSKRRIPGWQAIRRGFHTPGESGRPLLTIHPDCRETLRSIRSLVYDTKTDDAADTKGDDQADALRYWCMSPMSPLRP
jgi:hypothetical protein